MRDEYYPIPVTNETLAEIADELIRKTALQGSRVEMYALAIDDFIGELRNRMNQSGTVFYQP